MISYLGDLGFTRVHLDPVATDTHALLFAPPTTSTADAIARDAAAAQELAAREKAAADAAAAAAQIAKLQADLAAAKAIPTTTTKPAPYVPRTVAPLPGVQVAPSSPSALRAAQQIQAPIASSPPLGVPWPIWIGAAALGGLIVVKRIL